MYLCVFILSHSLWFFFCFISVISLHSHNLFSIVQKCIHNTSTPINLTSFWKCICHFKPNWSFPPLFELLSFNFFWLLFAFDIVIPPCIVHMFTWFYEGGVDLAWPNLSAKFATWQEKTPIKSSSSSSSAINVWSNKKPSKTSIFQNKQFKPQEQHTKIAIFKMRNLPKKSNYFITKYWIEFLNLFMFFFSYRFRNLCFESTSNKGVEKNRKRKKNSNAPMTKHNRFSIYLHCIGVRCQQSHGSAIGWQKHISIICCQTHKKWQ